MRRTSSATSRRRRLRKSRFVHAPLSNFNSLHYTTSTTTRAFARATARTRASRNGRRRVTPSRTSDTRATASTPPSRTTETPVHAPCPPLPPPAHRVRTLRRNNSRSRTSTRNSPSPTRRPRRRTRAAPRARSPRTPPASPTALDRANSRGARAAVVFYSRSRPARVASPRRRVVVVSRSSSRQRCSRRRLRAPAASRAHLAPRAQRGDDARDDLSLIHISEPTRPY